MSRILFIFFFSLFSITIVTAQISTTSPYSRFGLGDINYGSLPEFNSFGGAVVAHSNPFTVNPFNPASYTSIGPNSFLLSTGGWHQTTSIMNNNSAQIANNNGFSHFVLGFPLNKNMAASLGMLPFSSIGYSMSTAVVDENDTTHNAIANYYGDGGISKIYFGGAYQVTDNLSLGLNASFLFGGLNRRKSLVYNNEDFFNSRSNSKINLKGYYYEFGLLYSKELTKGTFSFGLTTNNNSKIRGKKTELIESFEFSGILEIPKDTFVNSVEWGDIILPKHLKAGIEYKNKKMVFLAQYSLQNWSEYSMFSESDDLVDTESYSAGLRYTPDYNSINSYLKRLDYNVGISFRNIPLQFENNQLEELELTFGVGFPVKKSRTKYNLFCAIGQRGTTENNLLKEKFIRLGLSVNFDGIWFVKRKYD
tara:strand:- start:143987 stop:145249 length:1263 start_codon:yes stop_codon:yes gene_type:complete